MTKKQQQALDLLVRTHKADDSKLALIIIGSVASKKEKMNSDIDLYLVVTDEAFIKVQQNRSYFYGSWDPKKYCGVGIDGKIIGKDFLHEAVKRGSEPTRASFLNAYTEFSKDPEIMPLVQKIAVYPEWEQKDRCCAFYGMMKHFRYEGEQALENNNFFYLKSCVQNLIFFSARLILGHNRILYPCRKSLFKTLKQAEDQPRNFKDNSEKLLECREIKPFIEYYESIAQKYPFYELTDDIFISLLLENELNWFTGAPDFERW